MVGGGPLRLAAARSQPTHYVVQMEVPEAAYTFSQTDARCGRLPSLIRHISEALLRCRSPKMAKMDGFVQGGAVSPLRPLRLLVTSSQVAFAASQAVLAPLQVSQEAHAVVPPPCDFVPAFRWMAPLERCSRSSRENAA